MFVALALSACSLPRPPPIDEDGGIDGTPGGIVVDNQVADLVLGQPNYASGAPDSGFDVAASSLDSPGGIATDGAVLYVGDSNNGRVLIWSPLPTTSWAPAQRVLGRTSFTDDAVPTTVTGANLEGQCCGTRVALVGDVLAVSDTFRSRVLVWSPVPTTNGASAILALGQSNLTNEFAGASAMNLHWPYGVWSDGTRVVVADSRNNRVLIWTSFPTTNGTAADVVLGQSSFDTSDIPPSPTPSSMRDPVNAFFDGTRLYVSDASHHRVLVWNGLPMSNGQAADYVLGQPDLESGGPSTSPTGMRGPEGIIVVGDALLVADAGNDRVLVFSPIPTESGVAATHVLGQPNLSTGGNDPAPTQSSLDGPCDFAVADDNLFVVDRGHNRVLRFTLALP